LYLIFFKLAFAYHSGRLKTIQQDLKILHGLSGQKQNFPFETEELDGISPLSVFNYRQKTSFMLFPSLQACNSFVNKCQQLCSKKSKKSRWTTDLFLSAWGKSCKSQNVSEVRHL